MLVYGLFVCKDTNYSAITQKFFVFHFVSFVFYLSHEV